jgi:uncharacterized protein (DUF1800 family)
MAHLMRRAGFGATRQELERRAAIGYEETVEELLSPESQEPVDIYEFWRYFNYQWKPGTLGGIGQSSWVWRMINTNAPLQEKMTVFWHQIFATGVSKVDHYDEITDMVDMFREKGLGKYREVLMDVAKNPAMIFWLDNNQNHGAAVNENWGRELLELFTMGVGSYTEVDVRECSRAFTGWTMSTKLPRFPMGRFDWHFVYKADDHDNGDKSFLGHTGNFNGEDVIDIILQQPATAEFIARHLYNFFVADEAQVPAWSVTTPRDAEAIDLLARALIESDYEMRPVLRLLFNSDFFKAARFAKVKSPADAVVGMLRFVGDAERPQPAIMDWSNQITYMGQELLNPPSVEGWHTGTEWINSGSLMRRTNFFAEMVGDVDRPGVRGIVEELRSNGRSPEQVVDTCLELMGPMEVDADARTELVDHVASDGGLSWDDEQASGRSEERVSELLQLIVALREFQFS